MAAAVQKLHAIDEEVVGSGRNMHCLTFTFTSSRSHDSSSRHVQQSFLRCCPKLCFTRPKHYADAESDRAHFGPQNLDPGQDRPENTNCWQR